MQSSAITSLLNEGWSVHPEQEDPRWMLLCKPNSHKRSVILTRACCLTTPSGDSPCGNKILKRRGYMLNHVEKCDKTAQFLDNSLQILEEQSLLYGKYIPFAFSIFGTIVLLWFSPIKFTLLCIS
jgi:hypothetical protein